MPQTPSLPIALNGCRIERVLENAVEIVDAAAENRSFPDRVNESLGVCLKAGPEHEVRADGRALRYPGDAICVRAPGTVWSTRATGSVGFLSIDIESCLACGQAALAQAYDRLGNSDSAIAVYERYVTTPSAFRLFDQGGTGPAPGAGPFSNDATQLAPSYKRLGELYEERRDRAKARHYYSRFVELWKDSDPELKPVVSVVRQRLRQLAGERSNAPLTPTPAPEPSEPGESERPQS